MGPHPDWWEVHDSELEERVVAPSDRTRGMAYWLLPGQQIDIAAQAMGMASNRYGHNRQGWRLQ